MFSWILCPNFCFIYEKHAAEWNKRKVVVSLYIYIHILFIYIYLYIQLYTYVYREGLQTRSMILRLKRISNSVVLPSKFFEFLVSRLAHAQDSVVGRLARCDWRCEQCSPCW